MTPERAGKICDDLDKRLRGAEMNLDGVADLVVTVIRDQAWRKRKIRTGEVIECASFIELLTAPPLKGYGENPAKVEALLKDDPEALRLFREATTAPSHRPDKQSNDNVITSKQGNSRAYTLDRLHREAPALYAKVVAKELTANQAAVKAGFRKVPTALDALRKAWNKASASERAEFLSEVSA